MDTAPDGVIKPFFSAETIATRVDQLASEIATTRLNDLMVVAVLKGSFIFAADLIRALQRKGLKPEIDFIFLASYDGDRISRGEVRVLRDVDSDVRGRNVVIVDDIFDSGRTLAFAKSLLLDGGASRVLTCVLLDKQVPRRRRSPRTLWDFPARRCSWSATAWISTTAIASFPLSAS